jgi:putative membrane protein insertion efficiency factor
MKTAALASIRFYKRNVSALLPSACRFQPTCSVYGYEAIEKHGLIKGIGLTAWRVLRCNPLNRNRGYDPVP